MEYQFDQEWTLHPIEGDTGQAFMGIHKQEKIFIKRNSSPFLAALSMEGITPRLIWTKRMTNGDVVSAQEWLSGHILSSKEMGQGIVVQLLHHYHHSDNLYNMLVKIGGKSMSPIQLLEALDNNLSEGLRHHQLIQRVREYLSQTTYTLEHSRQTVCHGDLNRRNFLLSDQNRLYLVDWESAMIADPMYDITQILIQYIPLSDWDRWFDLYGLHLSDEVYYRIEWYALYNLLLLINREFAKERFYQVNQHILKLKYIYENRYLMQENSDKE